MRKALSVTLYCYLVATFAGKALSASLPDREVYATFQARVLRLALEQAKNPSRNWDPGQRDCSGLIRYLYRSLLGPTFKGWLRKDKKYYDYASAEDLIHNNFYFVEKTAERSHIQTGDVLVFYSENKKTEDRFHLMMILKSPYSNSNETLLVYHNGASGNEGAVRKVSLREFQADLNNEWRPNQSNPRFKGVYRWLGWKGKT